MLLLLLLLLDFILVLLLLPVMLFYLSLTLVLLLSPTPACSLEFGCPDPPTNPQHPHSMATAPTTCSSLIGRRCLGLHDFGYDLSGKLLQARHFRGGLEVRAGATDLRCP